MNTDVNDFVPATWRSSAVSSSAVSIRICRREALKHHPDKNNADPEAESRFKRVLAAYECITKPEDEFEPSIYEDMDEEALYRVFSRYGSRKAVERAAKRSCDALFPLIVALKSY